MLKISQAQLARKQQITPCVLEESKRGERLPKVTVKEVVVE